MANQLTLTQKDVEDFQQFMRDNWIPILKESGPIDLEKLRPTIEKCYKLEKHSPPKGIIIVPSPLAMILTGAILENKPLVQHLLKTAHPAEFLINLFQGLKETSSDRTFKDTDLSMMISPVLQGAKILNYRGKETQFNQDQLIQELRQKSQELRQDCGYGNHDCFWLGYYEYFKKFHPLPEILKETSKLDGLFEYARQGGWFLFYDDLAIVAERPKIMLDEQLRYSNTTGPAVKYADGWDLYLVHEIPVNPDIINGKIELTPKLINEEQNQEVKRVLMEIYGFEKYIENVGAKLVHSEMINGQEYWLYKADIANDEPMVGVKCINSSPEPDGSFKAYFLRVDPQCRPMLDGPNGTIVLGDPQKLTARNAVASTFGKRGEDYNPDVET